MHNDSSMNTNELIWNGQVSMNINLKLTWLLYNIVIYPCTGYYLNQRVEIKSFRKYLPGLWILNFLLIMLSCYATYHVGRVTGKMVQNGSQLFVSSFAEVNCISIFMTIKALFDNDSISERRKKVIVSMGSCCFGIYLIHYLLFGFPLFKNLRGTLIKAIANPMLAIWIYVLIVVLISGSLTYIWKLLYNVLHKNVQKKKEAIKS